jgi:hypothetical protein
MITNRSEDKLDVIAYSAPPDNRGGLGLLGHPVLPQDLNLTHPRFCPHCVRERGFLEAHWDLALMVACPASLQARLSVLDFPITVRDAQSCPIMAADIYRSCESNTGVIPRDGCRSGGQSSRFSAVGKWVRIQRR